MKYKFVSQFDKREKADVLVLPFWEKERKAPLSLESFIEPVFATGDFKGKNGETFFVYPKDGKEARILLLGLGHEDKGSIEFLRRAIASALRAIKSVKAKSANIVIPKHKKLDHKEILIGFWEGILLSNYSFHKLMGEGLKDAPSFLEKVGLVGIELKDTKILEETSTIMEGVYFARDLVNDNADEIIPFHLAETAREIEKVSPKIKTTIRDRAWLEKQKMGLILAVNRASHVDPFLIEVAYKGNPKSKQHIVLVGKGVTYDTGGLSIKPTDGMCGMKSDMAGAAAVLATVRTIAQLNLKVNVTVVVPSVENAIGSKSYKLGDVYRSYSGKTVEINNTDAEGRLILADALSYTVKNLHPSLIIDLATLTGSVVVTFGEMMAGFCSNDETLAKDLLNASSKTSDALWRLPLINEYKESFKSDIADLVNSGGRDAGAIKGALFLQEFIGNTKWAHLDIAGAAYWSKSKYYHPTKATGYGVQLLVEYLKHIHE
ncbi:MAG TPA: leucyl aminopeptidase [Chlamydiales bacterium]|nr:leucyl aminopeptidase [Chlamydiales bacterium]